MRTPGGSEPDAAFAEISRALLREPDVAEGKAFHTSGLTSDGQIFALLVDDELVVKLPSPRCIALIATDSARHFEFGGRRMREWVVIEGFDRRRWRELVKEALAFARR
ncbi:MAG TPA: hypothetical protein VEX36_05655 [Thermoleophilaceae bacterium]|nr:hypothetical protein [Thermoleophilaceae bacterium]